MPETAFDAADAALLRAGPAELVTFDSPCCALDTVLEAVCFAVFAALAAVSLAASAPLDAASAAPEVVDAARRWRTTLDCLRASRGSIVEAIV
jgi:hypothetical protein